MPTFNEAFFADSGLILMAITALAYILQVMIPRPWLRNLSSLLLASTLLSLVTSLVIRSITAQFFALSNMYEALLVMTIGLLLAYLIVDRWFRVSGMGWAVCLLGLVVMFYAGSLPQEINPLQAALRSYWRSIHVPPLLLSYGFFTLSFISSIGYLITHRRPGGNNPTGNIATRDGGSVLSFALDHAGDLYDEVTYRCIAAGFPLLMIGVILGAVWANEAWGNYWSWDPKESMSLVTLLGYGAYLHMRINGEHAKSTLAWVSVAGFLLMMMTFVGVNMWGFGSIHSYGSVK